MKDGVEIHYLTKKKFSTIVENNPYVSKVYTIEKSIEEVSSLLKKENYAVVIDLHKNIRSARLRSYLRKPVWFTFDKLNIAKWLLVKAKVNRMPNVHVVDRYLATIEMLGIQNDGNGLDFFIPREDMVTKEQIPHTHRRGYIAVAVGAAHATKAIPVEKLISILKKVEQPLILLGDKNDYAKGEEIVKVLGEKVYNACGKYNINQSAAFIQGADAVLSCDTGLMHIASAFKKKIVSVWGSTVPQFGMYPYLPGKGSYFAEVKGLKCRPCSKIGFKTCPKKHFDCMMKQDENRIAEVLNGN